MTGLNPAKSSDRPGVYAGNADAVPEKWAGITNAAMTIQSPRITLSPLRVAARPVAALLAHEGVQILGGRLPLAAVRIGDHTFQVFRRGGRQQVAVALLVQPRCATHDQFRVAGRDSGEQRIHGVEDFIGRPHLRFATADEEQQRYQTNSSHVEASINQ